MRTLLFFLPIIFLFLACGGQTSGTTTTGTDTDSTAVTDVPTDMETPAEPPAVGRDCPMTTEVLDGNRIRIREENLLVVITADSTTYDADLGPGHRVLEVYDTRTCERIQREVLPVSVSPDFPYFLAEITYNTGSKLVGIRGARNIYIYDVGARRLLPELKPRYLSERFAEDAQSGNILRLEVWENYLIGFAEDQGTFAFDLNNASEPKAILPVAEFKLNENEFVPLFGFPSSEGRVQLTMPAYDRDTDGFSINALFSGPQPLNTNIGSGARNNRYIVLRRSDEGRAAVAVDMQNRKLIDLPADVATQPTQAVLQWIRQR